jgi:hypothetical protein
MRSGLAKTASMPLIHLIWRTSIYAFCKAIFKLGPYPVSPAARLLLLVGVAYCGDTLGVGG